MIRRITLVDFMAHARTEIALGPGLTVLCGPNNTGKSAVVEALRCLATNPTPKHYIRHGASQARVEVTLDDGVRLAWVRRDKYALYELTRPGGETETFAKFGRKPPEEVLSVLRLNQVELEDAAVIREIDVHLGNQREPIFLLQQTKTAVASFFASTTESAHLIKMQNLLKNRVAKAKAFERELAARMGGVEGELDALAPLPGLVLGLETAREELAGLKTREEEITALSGRIADLAGAGRDQEKAREAAASLAGLAVPPELAPTVALGQMVGDLARLAAAGRVQSAKAAALSVLAPPGPAHDCAALAGLAATLKHLNDRRKATQRTGSALAGLAAPPELAATAALDVDVNRLAALTRETSRLAARQGALAPLREAPELAPPEGLAGLATGIAALTARRDQAARQAAEAAKRLAALEGEIATRLRQIKACPLCGSRPEPEAFFAGAALAGGEG